MQKSQAIFATGSLGIYITNNLMDLANLKIVIGIDRPKAMNIVRKSPNCVLLVESKALMF
jgi:RNase P/RNase MRP subunit p30